MLNALRSKGSNTFVWIIIGLLIIGLAGFGVGNSGGGTAATPVAQVGEAEVSVDEYVRAINTQNRQLAQQVGRAVTIEEMRAFGLDQVVMDGLLSEATLNGEAQRIGISVGDKRVREMLLATRAFHGLSGKFDKQTYEYALENGNLTPRIYEDIIRKQETRLILQASVASGIRVPETAARVLVNYQTEKRSLEWVRLDASHLSDPISAPSESDLKEFYDRNAATYTLPETREITYAHVTEGMLADQVDVPEADIRALFEERRNEYSFPARRIVDRIVFPDTETADSALGWINDGTQTFDTIAADRGLTPDDIDLGEVIETALNDAERAALFGTSEPGIFGPIDSDLGPALYRINAVLDASDIPFEDMRDELREEIALEEADALIADALTPIDVLIAGGSSIEDIAAESILELGTVTLTPDTTDGIAADAAFRDEAFAAALGEDRDIKDLSDGVFLLRVDSLQDPTLQPLQDVRVDVSNAWKKQETSERLMALAESLKAQIDDGEALGTVAVEFGLIVTEEAPLGRTDIIEDTPPDFVTSIFESAPGKGAVAADEETVLLARITDIIAADPESDDVDVPLQSVRGQQSQTTAADVMYYFVRGLQEDAGVSVNTSLLTQIQTQLSAY